MVPSMIYTANNNNIDDTKQEAQSLELLLTLSRKTGLFVCKGKRRDLFLIHHDFS